AAGPRRGARPAGRGTWLAGVDRWAQGHHRRGARRAGLAHRATGRPAHAGHARSARSRRPRRSPLVRSAGRMVHRARRRHPPRRGGLSRHTSPCEVTASLAGRTRRTGRTRGAGGPGLATLLTGLAGLLVQRVLGLLRHIVDLVGLVAELGLGETARLVQALLDLVTVLAQRVLSLLLDVIEVDAHVTNAPASALQRKP